MINKERLLECSITNFIKFGSKRFTMDELAFELGISKKTIYTYFKNKEILVSESLSFLIEKIKREIDIRLLKHDDPIVKIIEIYRVGFEYFNSFKPSFIFGLKKYYPKADDVFETFRNEIVFEKIYNLLVEAKQQKLIKEDVNLRLVCELYFLRIDSIIYKSNGFFERFTNKELLEHLVIYNLKGISSIGYSNEFFE